MARSEVVVLTLRKHHKNNDKREWWNRTYKKEATTRQGIAAKKWLDPNDSDFQKIFKTSKNWKESLGDLKKAGNKMPNYHLKDWLIIINPNSADPEVHYVSTKMVARTGSLYQHNGKKWEHIIIRYTVSKTLNEDSSDLPSRYDHLGWVKGHENWLLLTSATAKNAEDAKSMLYGKMPVSYKYVNGLTIDDAVITNDAWRIKGESGKTQDTNILEDQEEEKKKEEARQKADEFEGQMQLSLDHIKKKNTTRTALKLIKTTLQILFEQGAPGIEAGTATPLATTNMIAGWASSDGLSSEWLGSTVGQGVHESAGLGLKLVLDLYRLHKHNNDNSADHKERKTIYHDIASSVAKGPPTVTTIVDTIGKLANSGQQMAGIAVTANTVMPLIGAAISLEESARNFRKSDKAVQRLLQLRTAAGWMFEDGQAGEVDAKSELGLLTLYSVRKLSRRSTRLGVTGMAGAFGGVGGTILGVAAVTGAANAWNPIGWTLMSVALVGGVGVTGYVIYRRATKGTRHEKRTDRGIPATSLEFAERLIKVYTKGAQGDENHHKVAGEMLEAFGVPVKRGKLNGIDKPKAINRINRHLTR
jgi:hypothetical protein